MDEVWIVHGDRHDDDSEMRRQACRPIHRHYWPFGGLMARGKKPARSRLVLDFMLLHLLRLGSCENREWLGWVVSFRIRLVFLRQRLVCNALTGG